MNEDRLYLVHISECIANVEELTASGKEAFFAAKHDKAAVLYYLQTLAESTQRLSESIKNTHPEIEWAKIVGFRNRLVHGYMNVNLLVVWDIIEKNLPALKMAVQNMLESLDDEPT